MFQRSKRYYRNRQLTITENIIKFMLNAEMNYSFRSRHRCPFGVALLKLPSFKAISSPRLLGWTGWVGRAKNQS